MAAPAHQRPPRLLSLRLSIPAGFVLGVLATSVILCSVIFVRFQRVMRDDIRLRIHDIVSLGALQVDGDLHRTIRSAEDESSVAYLAIKRQLQRIRDASVGLRFVYTMRLAAGNTSVFVVDAESDPGKASHVGEAYPQTTPLMLQVLTHPGAAAVEEQFDVDRWGTWLSGYAPVFAADGSLECLLGVDLSASGVRDSERSALRLLALIALAITVAVSLVGIAVSRWITRPLAALELDMVSVRDLNLDQVVGVRSRFREIVRMRNTLETMKNGLRSFRKYVPTELVRQLISLGQEARLGSRRMPLTIFFSDIEGFTTLSEQLPPEQISEDLAEHFAFVTSTILEAGGTVDKYIGDAVMAFWGAPAPLPDHAARALTAALRVQRGLDEINARKLAAGKPALVTRIGLATGEVVVGNFGYEQRLNYTAVGDRVNLASRLEGANKRFGTRVLACADTAAAAGDTVLSRAIARVAVKGKREGVVVYEPLATVGRSDGSAGTEWLPPSPGTTPASAVQEWNLAFAARQRREWAAALPVFAAWVARNPADQAAALLAEECRELLASPPGPEWDGICRLHEK